MDRSTFSKWGSVVCVVLVVAIMMAFATPFGQNITAGVKTVLSDFKEASTFALTPSYTVKLNQNIPEAGTATFAGEHAGETSLSLKGEVELTVEATENMGYRFVGWYDGDTLLSANKMHTFTTTKRVIVRAVYEVRLAPGLYDEDDNLVASWDELVNTYGMDVAKNYYESTYKKDTASPYYVLTENAALSSGKNLVMGNVNKVGNYAFYEYNNLSSVEIPASITAIGKYAFAKAAGLKTITFDEDSQLTSISERAFWNCPVLESVTFNKNSQLKNIGDLAFSACTNLANIEIPASVTKLGKQAFYMCDSFTSIVIPDSVTSIGNLAFSKCTSLTSVTFEENSQLTSISEGTFTQCANLTNIEIPTNVTSIGKNAFEGCTRLTSIGPVGSGASVEIPSGLKTIDSTAFMSCTNLASVTFGENSQLTTIGYGAFTQCTNLTNIEIPANVTSIGNQVFYSSPSLKTITVLASTPPNINNANNGTFYTCNALETITVPNGTLAAYQTAWSSVASKLVEATP